MVSLNKALLGPYFLGGVALGGGTLGSYDNSEFTPEKWWKTRPFLLKWSLVRGELGPNSGGVVF